MISTVFAVFWLSVQFAIGPILASWLAFGSSPLFWRLLVVLAGAYLLGCTWLDLPWSPVPPLAGILLIACCIAVALRPSRLGFAIFGVCLLPFVGGFIFSATTVTLDRESSARIGGTVLVVFLAASGLGVVRTLGFRVLPLLNHVSDEDLERGTGQGLDEWLRTLMVAHGRNVTHAEIRTELRNRGLDDRWQVAVADAIERALGRIEVGAAGARRLVVVAPEELKNARSPLGYPFQQLTSRQLLVFTFCAAVVSWTLRQFRWDHITPPLVAGGLVALITDIVVGGLFVWGALGINRFRETLAAAWFCGLLLAVFNLSLLGIGLKFDWPYVLQTCLAAAAASGYLTMGLLLLRRRGYRFVRLAAVS